MKKLISALSISAIIAGGAIASSLEDSDVSNTVGVENSEIVQKGYKNTVSVGTEIKNSSVKNSTINNEVYMKNSSIRQQGGENYIHTGTKVE